MVVVWVAGNAVERVEHAEEAGEAREKWVNIIVDDQVVIEEVVEAGAQEDEEGEGTSAAPLQLTKGWVEKTPHTF